MTDEKALRKTVEESLSVEDLHRIKAMKDFEMIDKEKDILGWNIAVACDDLRRKLGIIEMTLDKAMYEIKLTLATRLRYGMELKAGSITTELRPGVPMIKEELQAEFDNMQSRIIGMVRDLHPVLGKYRGLVGHLGVDGRTIVTKEEFDKNVKDIETELKELGYPLFE